MKQIALAVLALLLFSSVVLADSAPTNPPLEVTFTAVFTSSIGQTETITGGFEDVFSEEAGEYILDPGTGKMTASGFLGTTFASPVQLEPSFMQFFGANGDEIDLFLFGDLLPSQIPGFFIFNCVDANCGDPFPTSQSFTVTPIQTPEPPLFAMTLLGLVALAFMNGGLRFSGGCSALRLAPECNRAADRL